MVLGRIFGKKKKEPEVTTSDALDRLRNTEGILLKKQELLEKKIEAEIRTAQKHGMQNKRLALKALKNKKLYEGQLRQLDGTLNTIQNQIESLQNSSINAEVLQVMSTASKALRGAHNNMSVDQIHDLLEDVTEQRELADEIAQAISRPMGQQDFDDDDLLAELNQLEQEELINVGPSIESKALPAVPTDELSRIKIKADDELAQLQAWAESG